MVTHSDVDSIIPRLVTVQPMYFLKWIIRASLIGVPLHTSCVNNLVIHQARRGQGREEDRKFSATRPCGSKGTGRCDTTTKLRASSSGCKSCPARGEPARAGSKPGAVRGNTVCDAEACERAGRGTAAPKPLLPGGRESWMSSKATTALCVSGFGQGGGCIRRGVRPEHARRGRSRHPGGPRLSSTHPGFTESRSRGRWGQGVGGRHTSVDVGERPGTLDPAEHRRPVSG
jgi:hypothetical protein